MTSKSSPGRPQAPQNKPKGAQEPHVALSELSEAHQDPFCCLCSTFPFLYEREEREKTGKRREERREKRDERREKKRREKREEKRGERREEKKDERRETR